MKVWLTRKSAFSLQCGGLDRVDVWFRKPTYVENWWKSGFHPFGPENDKEGIIEAGWRVIGDNTSGVGSSFSFGKVFGYCDRDEPGENDLANMVWQSLCDHFGTTNLREWEDTPERDPHKWLMEINLNIEAYIPM